MNYVFELEDSELVLLVSELLVSELFVSELFVSLELEEPLDFDSDDDFEPPLPRP
ncbi:MAG TPA: hypothetical protein VKU01_25800 [Bryobacteraceae bacterium]|nr:hypothetical protein [Bryobacteraceae bacterium]